MVILLLVQRMRAKGLSAPRAMIIMVYAHSLATIVSSSANQIEMFRGMVGCQAAGAKMRAVTSLQG